MAIETSHVSRRRFTAGAISAGASLLSSSKLLGESPRVLTVEPGAANTLVVKPGGSWPSPHKQIEAGLLNVGYAEAGPSDGPPVLLLHGWPYDIYSFADVAPLLASRGYRVIVPYLRGFGTTSFLSSETLRNGQQSVLLSQSQPSLLKVKLTVRYTRMPVPTPPGFPGIVHRTILGGIGHNLPQEAPNAFVRAIVDVDRY